MLELIRKWRKKPPPNEIHRRFMDLNWKLFSTEDGQELLWLLKQRINYDANPYKVSNSKRELADMHEGMKDCIRLIEESLQQYDRVKTKEKENGSS